MGGGASKSPPSAAAPTGNAPKGELKRGLTTLDSVGYNPAAGKLYMYQFGIDAQPSAEQMKAFYRGVAKVTVAVGAADGVLDPEERLFLKHQGIEMGLTIDQKETDKLCDATERAVSSRGMDAVINEVGALVKGKAQEYKGLEKRMLYLAVCAATADGVLDPKEKEAAEKFAAIVNLPTDFVDEAYAIAKAEEESKIKRGKLLSGGHPALMAKHY